MKLNLLTLPTQYSSLTWQMKREVRSQYLREQKGLCMWCNHDIYDAPPKRITQKDIDWSLFPPNFLKYPIHLQHNHDTDMTEGVVHAYCNAVMWQYHER